VIILRLVAEATLTSRHFPTDREDFPIGTLEELRGLGHDVLAA
jgi:hypothetical protein